MITVRAAGVREFGRDIQALDLPDPRGPRAGEVLIEVHAAGVGNWDEYVRTGAWDTGIRPPMALGVEAAGVIVAVGPGNFDLAPGNRVTTHSLPLPGQGAWAEYLLAAAADTAPLPGTTEWAGAAALPVPALTADQSVRAAGIAGGQTVLVHGASGVTGGLLVQLSVLAGANVIATSSPAGAARIKALGAHEVLDYHDPQWPGQAWSLAGGGVHAALNAARGGAATAISAIRDAGVLVTITGDPPDAERGIKVSAIEVTPDGPRLAELARLLADGSISVTVGARYPLDQGAAALTRVRAGLHGAAAVIEPNRTARAGPGVSTRS
jgi:NADPH:quinone reductase-like Zn-dependent oxidoreductase